MNDSEHHPNDNSRIRNIFPLPKFKDTSMVSTARLSASVRKRVARKTAWLELANDCVASLNSMSGFPPDSGGLVARNLSQVSCLDHIQRSCQSLGCPDASRNFDRKALGELLVGASVYDSEGGAVIKPYNKDLVSWLDEGRSPINLKDCLDAADYASLGQWREKLLGPANEFLTLRNEL